MIILLTDYLALSDLYIPHESLAILKQDLPVLFLHS